MPLDDDLFLVFVLTAGVLVTLLLLLVVANLLIWMETYRPEDGDID